MTDIPHYLRRDYRTHKDEHPLKLWMIVLILLFIAALYADQVMHLTEVMPIAHAEEVKPEEATNLEAQCAFAGLYPEKIINLGDLQRACADNNTVVELMK
jgi:hypothetical protein